MIRSLSIKNYALIQSLEMTPSPNLNIITGETGAGKSIMLGAVGLLLGNRADTRALFSDQEKCIIEGTFSVDGYQLQPLFDEADLDYEAECIIRREISPSGKSRAFVNDTPVTLDVLKKLGIHLMDIHSQHESLHLGSNQYQLEILDIFAGHEELLQKYRAAYTAFKQAKKHYEELTQKAQNSAQDADYKQFLYDELQQADLETDEQIQLEDELKILEHAEEIKLNLGQLTQVLDEAEFSVINQLKEAIPLLSSLRGFSDKLENLHERLDSAVIEIEDIAKELADEQDHVELDPERLQIIKDRLDLIFRLQQKHHTTEIADLIALRDRLGEELENVLNIDEAISKAEKALQAAEKEAQVLAKKLSASRKKHAGGFASAIKALIQKLGIENGEVTIDISEDRLNSNGVDLVEFLFSANKGVAPRELKHVASGGEFSRLIFAIKYLLADKTAMPTIIFDEIDTGVSGEIALQMVNMMKQMSSNHQVISISHLPQFAAGGDAHYFVYKDHSSDKSVSRIKKLHNDERVLAIAQMIGGEKPGESALQSARELLGAR